MAPVFGSSNDYARHELTRRYYYYGAGYGYGYGFGLAGLLLLLLIFGLVWFCRRRRQQQSNQLPATQIVYAEAVPVYAGAQNQGFATASPYQYPPAANANQYGYPTANQQLPAYEPMKQSEQTTSNYNEPVPIQQLQQQSVYARPIYAPPTSS
ncbi:hypothetical protein HK100_010180 [Physocladia obscura]|uniref:Uncharacterized protein n=1 Tax=Physocladia obscura TaxID=109957 RepID=A0AAD5T4E0_9FUNG|nr:hypothetical protein HK100_010180 [Physocladia obscura]